VIGRIRQTARLAWIAFNRFQEHSGPDRAAAVAYYTLLSLLPMLVFLISLGVKLLGSFDDAYRATMFLVRGVTVHMDRESLENLRSFVEASTRFRWPGLLLLAWTSRRIFAALFSALEKVFGVPGRNFAKHNLVALAMVLVTGIGLLVTMTFTTLLATVEGLIGRYTGDAERETLHVVWRFLLTGVLPVGITFAFFLFVYRIVPRRSVSTRHALTGAVLATTMWELAKWGFAYYVRDVARYAGLYGALAAIIVLGLWLELSVSIILYCGEVVALISPPRRVVAPAPPEEALPPSEPDPTPAVAQS